MAKQVARYPPKPAGRSQGRSFASHHQSRLVIHSNRCIGEPSGCAWMTAHLEGIFQKKYSKYDWPSGRYRVNPSQWECVWLWSSTLHPNKDANPLLAARGRGSTAARRVDSHWSEKDWRVRFATSLAGRCWPAAAA